MAFLYLDNITSFFGGSTVFFLGVYGIGADRTSKEERASK